jgi:hypothetical protein
MAVHTITCAHEDCEEWASLIHFQPTGDLAAEHRADLATHGWADFEGRDYCPVHHPTRQETR